MLRLKCVLRSQATEFAHFISLWFHLPVKILVLKQRGILTTHCKYSFCNMHGRLYIFSSKIFRLFKEYSPKMLYTIHLKLKNNYLLFKHKIDNSVSLQERNYSGGLKLISC